MSKMLQLLNKHFSRSRKVAEFRTSMKLWQPLSRPKNRTTVSLILLTCWHKKLMHSKITISTLTRRLPSISYLQNRTKLRKDEKFKNWRTNVTSWRKTSVLLKVNAIIFRANLTWSKVMSRKWYRCSNKPDSNRMLLTSKLMTRTHNSTRTTLATTLPSLKSTFLIS